MPSPAEQEILDQLALKEMTRFHGELIAAGVEFTGVDSNDILSDLNPAHASLAALVIAAKGKALASTECQAVKTALGEASSQWVAYQAVRNAWAEHQRTEKLLVEVVTMIAELFYTAVYNNAGLPVGVPKFNMTKLQEAKTRIDEIKAQYPYLT
jgi:hypothetical protein